MHLADFAPVLLVAVVAACAGSTTQASSSPIPSPSAAESSGPALSSSDRDHDGIVDACDACPDEPETMNGICDEDGCPDIAAGVFPAVRISLKPVLLFDKQSNKITALSQPLVDQVARDMLANKDVFQIVAILGHASRDEVDADTTALSRAVAVRQALAAQGVDSIHLDARSVGARRPLDEHDPSLNRRVEFVVLRAAGREQFRLEGDTIAEVPAAPTGAGASCRPRPTTCSR